MVAQETGLLAKNGVRQACRYAAADAGLEHLSG
jgi:hypothetical protein